MSDLKEPEMLYERPMRADLHRAAEALAQADEGLLLCEDDGEVSFANPAAEFLLNCPRADLSPEQFGVGPGQRAGPMWIDVTSADGKRRVLEFRSEPLGGPNPCTLIRLRDDSASHTQAASLRGEVRRRDEFLGMLAHEMRNPLSAMQHAVALLRMADCDGPTRELAADTFDRQFSQVKRILEDLTDATRASRGQFEVRPQACDLADVLAGAAETLRPASDDKGHTFEVLTGPGVPVNADPARLGQVFINLLHNAVKFTPAGGHVRLTLLSDGADAVVRVEDSGPGVPEAVRPMLFEPFAQGKRPPGGGGGLGIGLGLAKRIIDLHGGRLALIDAAELGGACFEVRLPAADHQHGHGQS